VKIAKEPPGFVTPLTARKEDRRTWTLTEDLVYRSLIEGVGEVIVPAGFTTDLASTPRIMWFVLPPDGSYTPAATLHDFLYRKKHKSRTVSDKVFLEAMASLGTYPGVRHVIWGAVRLFGWSFYGKAK